jgi:haloalkane dehalogenase
VNDGEEAAVGDGQARPSWVDDELFPFASRFLEVHGHRVHYVDEGEGPTLLLLHGNPTWSFVYRDVIARLRSGFRCVALDYPGFGLSEAATGYRFLPEEHAGVVAAAVEQLDLTDVTVVLHDWGGPIGVAAAARAPERYAGLVVGNTWAWPVKGDLHFEVFSRTMGGLVGRALVRRLNLFVNAMIPAGHRRRRPTAAEMAHYRAAQASPERRQASAVLPQQIVGGRRFLAEVQAALPSVEHLPALIVWGEGDIAFRDRERQQWEELLPRSTTVRLPGVGHYLQSDAPHEFAEAIDRWHASLDDAERSGR